jgi:hypothetical protein
MNMKTFTQLMKEKRALEDKLKERAMIFQVSAKEEAALLFGFPLDYFYRVSYDRWSSIDRFVSSVKTRAEQDFRDGAVYMNSLRKKGLSKVTLGEIWKTYLAHNVTRTRKLKRIIKGLKLSTETPVVLMS